MSMWNILLGQAIGKPRVPSRDEHEQWSTLGRIEKKKMKVIIIITVITDIIGEHYAMRMGHRYLLGTMLQALTTATL